MKDTLKIPAYQMFFEKIFARLGLGMRAKLITLFIVIKVVPLVLLAFVAWTQSSNMGKELRKRSDTMAATLDAALIRTGDIAMHDAMEALDARATEDIERITTDIARRVADFLYARDGDIRLLAGIKPDASLYKAFVDSARHKVVKQGEWALNAETNRWEPVNRKPLGAPATSTLEENDLSFNYRHPDNFEYESRPLFLEATFIGLDGKEKIKVVASDRMDPALKDVSKRENTYVKAETYWEDLKNLQPGEIYVSEVIGAYVGSRVIDVYTPQSAARAGEPYDPEKSAFAGMENPLGKRFEGIVRWAAPVVEQGKITGYVTLALNHDHIMEFTNHIIPTSQRYTELSDASEGNYAFIWDYLGRNICHARHFSIAGYDPETGDPQVPWLEDRIYEDWKASGKSYAEFIKDVPVFAEQSVSRKPARDLTKAGLVGLDCRYLNFAPQCTGWFDLTRDGGSGSFVILWSGLRKLTTAAAIPYYTGRYAASKRGFGFVAVGAGVDDFHRPATRTREVINALIQETDANLTAITAETQEVIAGNLVETARTLSISTGLMAVVVIFIAIWMASVFTRSITVMISGISRFRSGERHFRFNSPIKDEMGVLADSFDDMADSIVESVKTPLVMVGTDGRIKYMNEQGLARLGKNLDDVLGKPYAEYLFHDGAAGKNAIDALLTGSESGVYHTESGGFFQDMAGYLTDKDGRVIGYAVTTTDVTEIVAGQNRLEAQRSLLDTIFTASPDMMWYKSGKGKYLAVNPRFASLAGMSAEEIVGRTTPEVFPPSSAESFHELDRQALAAQKPYYAEEELTFGDGHKEVVDSVRTPVRDQEGGWGILGVSRNVTRRVETENRLREVQLELSEAAKEANKANESKSQFLARMSHEIRTPMNAIIGMANIIKRRLEAPECDPHMIKTSVNQIEISSQHLLGLINDILDISKIEAGKIELAMEQFDLSRLISTVVSIIRPRCAEKNIIFTMNVDPGANALFVSDPLRLRQVLINLLGNAVKFTPECGEINFSLVRRDAKGGKILFEFVVADNGIGMNEHILSKLFSPFEQGDQRISRQYGGTGLGLSISRSIVRLMGGEIDVTSEEGKGSVFSFSLWLQESDTQEKSESAEEGLMDIEGKRVLLVDDVMINRMIVVDLLASSGLVIEEAEDGLQAVEKVFSSPENHYDIILMDIQMPNMDGYEAAKTIRAFERDDTRTVPIVAMTANAFREDVERAFASGMTGHMAKPLEFEKLVQLISGQVSARKK